MMKTKFCAALVAGVLVAPMAANADPVTQLIHFDDAGNGWQWYSDKDRNFLFDPTNLQSSSLCASDTSPPGNGSCVIEGTQGVLPKMTRPTNWGTTPGAGVAFGDNGPNNETADYGISGEALFTLDAFYFLLNGEGGKDKDTGLGLNAITVAGSNGASFTFKLGSNYDALGAPDVTFYNPSLDLGDGGLAGDLVKDTGYIATFGTLFKDVSWIQFSAPPTAQLRLDCVVATFNGTTTQPVSGFKNGCGITADDGGGGDDETVPEPATLALVGLGLLGAALARRRRS